MAGEQRRTNQKPKLRPIVEGKGWKRGETWTKGVHIDRRRTPPVRLLEVVNTGKGDIRRVFTPRNSRNVSAPNVAHLATAIRGTRVLDPKTGMEAKGKRAQLFWDYRVEPYSYRGKKKQSNSQKGIRTSAAKRRR